MRLPILPNTSLYKELIAGLACMLLAVGGLQAQDPAKRTDSLLQAGIAAYQKKDMDRSIHLLNQLLDQRDTNLVDSTNIRLYYFLSKAYGEKADYRKAYQMFNRYQTLQKQHFVQQKAEEVQAVQQKVDTLRKQKERLQEQADLRTNNEILRRKQRLLWGILTGILLLALSVLFSISSYRKKRKIYREAQKRTYHKLELESVKARQAGSLKERLKINNGLKDEVLPLLYDIKAQLSAWAVQNQEGIVHQSLAEVEEIIDRVCRQLEDTMLSLDIESGRVPSLEAAIEQLVAAIPSDHPLQVTFQYTGESRLRPDQQQVVYRIVQELIQNTIKHAQADHAEISMQFTAEGLHLTVSDNGRGFLLSSPREGMGLNTIKQRISALKGSMEMQTSDGVKYTLFIPYDPEG